MDFFSTLSTKFNINLNDQQRKAVKHLNGPALVLSGPGSGKTTVIISRTAYLVMEAGVNPDSILTMTFNRAATYEMEGRFKKVFGIQAARGIRFSTLHSFCNSVVRDYEKRQNKRLRRIEGNEDSEENKRKILKNIYQQVNTAAVNEDELENLINDIGLVKNKMLKELDEYDFSTKSFETIYKAYEDYKKSNLLIDFDDMLTYAYSILIKCPDILNFYRNKYRYIQLDEGQDLSKIQFEIVKLLVKSEDSNLFIVADDDQSIYGFRGAAPEYILNIEKDFPGCKKYWLENNYRSSRNIVEISSSFIKRNANRYDKNHTTGNDYLSDPSLIQVKNEHEQMKFVLDTIKSKIKEGCKAVAILYRNNLSSIAIADILDRNNIKFNIKQNKLLFFNHWVVQDILAFLKLALDQSDKDSFSRIYYKMNRYISKAMLEHALSADNSKSIIDGILTYSEIKPYHINQIAGIKGEFKQMARMQTIMALEYIEDSFNYFESVNGYCKSTGLSFEYLYSLFGILKTIALGYPAIPLFLQRVEELDGILSGTKQRELSGIILTTTHSSKGLEYDCVLMVDLTDEEFPGKRAIEAVQKGKGTGMLEEERRLFYVGMTRAKEQLYLISPQIRNGIKAAKSLFIGEVASCMNMKAVNQIGEGMLVMHKHFGEGVVVAVLESGNGRITLEIDFKGIRRKLDFATCMENGALAF